MLLTETQTHANGELIRDQVSDSISAIIPFEVISIFDTFSIDSSKLNLHLFVHIKLLGLPI